MKCSHTNVSSCAACHFSASIGENACQINAEVERLRKLCGFDNRTDKQYCGDICIGKLGWNESMRKKCRSRGGCTQMENRRNARGEEKK
jgi:hypothetical protein